MPINRRVLFAPVLAALTIAGYLAGVAGSTGVAHAAKPNNQACLGVDFSGYAQAGGADFGEFNAWLAQWVPGLGLPVQTHLAGLIDEEDHPNTCNDPD